MRFYTKGISMNDIQHKDTGNKGAFHIHKDGKSLAVLTYSKAGDDKIIIDHTEVDDSLRGQGIGESLVKAAVQWARDNEKKIMPLCPFANSVFKKNSSYQGAEMKT